MRIQQLGAYGYGSQITRSKQRERSEETDRKKSGSRFARHDSFEPSSGTAGKAESIKEVKKRVKTNFYTSDVVNEDLAEVFTKLFDR